MIEKENIYNESSLYSNLFGMSLRETFLFRTIKFSTTLTGRSNGRIRSFRCFVAPLKSLVEDIAGELGQATTS